GWIYLETGRHTVPRFPGADPIREYYPSDRPWRIPLSIETPETLAYFTNRVTNELIGYYRDTGVRDVFVERVDDPRLRNLWRFLQSNTSRFRVVYANGPIAVVRFERG